MSQQLAHLNRLYRAVGGDLLEHSAATAGLHGDSGLELMSVGEALAQLLLFKKRSTTEKASLTVGVPLGGGAKP